MNRGRRFLFKLSFVLFLFLCQISIRFASFASTEEDMIFWRYSKTPNGNTAVSDILKEYCSPDFEKHCKQLLDDAKKVSEQYKAQKVDESRGILKATLKDSDYYCTGNIKDGYPDGVCVIKTTKKSYSSLGNRYYIAEFKKGKPSGYAMIYYEDAPYDNMKWAEDCSMSKGGLFGIGYLKLKGEGLELSVDENNNALNLVYVGKFKNGNYDGDGKLFYTSEHSTTGNVKFDGIFKKGYLKKGKLFSENGNLVYEGEFFGGKYDGKGVLYNEDGSVKYKGKFKRGDIK